MRHLQESYTLARGLLHPSASCLIGALLSSAGFAAEPGADTAKRPNILWLSCEDIGPNLGCYGDAYADTPNLDNLAAEGLLFTKAFVNAAVCAPSRTGVITGIHPQTLGAHNMRSQAKLPADITTFTKYLRDAGYYCTNNNKEDYGFPTPADAWDQTNDRQAHWRNRKPGQPFFAVFNYSDTHEARSFRPRPDQQHNPDEAVVPPYLTDTPLTRRVLAEYYDCITRMDARIAERLRQLDVDGLADDTIVFFWSDHGWGMPRGKTWPYDSGLRVPLMVRCGKNFRHLMPENLADPGARSDQLISLIDLAPTVLNLAGVNIPDSIQGQAFLGPDLPPPRQYIYAARDRVGTYFDTVRTVRDERYLYLRNYLPHTPRYPWNFYHDKQVALQELRRLGAEGKLTKPQAFLMAPTRPVEELYDLETDPYEIHNLADSPAHQATLQRLRDAEADWVKRIGDLGLLPEGIMIEKADGAAPYDMARNKDLFPLERIHETALLADRGSSALPEIQHRLDDPDAAVRWWAVVGLERLGDRSPATLAALNALLKDDSPTVRIAAVRALWTCDYPSADLMPTLTEVLKSDVKAVLLDALVLLNDMEGQAAPALPELQELSGSDELFVKQTARHIVNGLKAGKK
jgi:N-sulfoglucosamine sulfohydrolase